MRTMVSGEVSLVMMVVILLLVAGARETPPGSRDVGTSGCARGMHDGKGADFTLHGLAVPGASAGRWLSVEAACSNAVALARGAVAQLPVWEAAWASQRNSSARAKSVRCVTVDRSPGLAGAELLWRSRCGRLTSDSVPPPTSGAT
jgi:hypothetical protein